MSAISAVLSFLIIGLGQIYAGKLKRGIFIFLSGYILIGIYFIPLALSVTSHHSNHGFIQRLASRGTTPIFMLFLPFWIYLISSGLFTQYQGSPIIFTQLVPVENVALAFIIIAIWLWQIFDAWKVEVNSMDEEKTPTPIKTPHPPSFQNQDSFLESLGSTRTS